MGIDGDGVGILQCSEVFSGLRLQIESMRSALVIAGRNHACEVSTPGSIGVDQEGKSLCLEPLSHSNDFCQSVHGAFFSCSNDGDHGVDGLVVVEAVLEVVFKRFKVNARPSVDVNADDMVGADAEDS